MGCCSCSSESARATRAMLMQGPACILAKMDKELIVSREEKRAAARAMKHAARATRKSVCGTRLDQSRVLIWRQSNGDFPFETHDTGVRYPHPTIFSLAASIGNTRLRRPSRRPPARASHELVAVRCWAFVDSDGFFRVSVDSPRVAMMCSWSSPETPVTSRD